MPDMEKVIRGLKAHGYTNCKYCPYWGTGHSGLSECTQLARDALALLKAQEPVIVKCTTKRTLVDDTYEVVYQDETFYDCPACGQRLSRWNKDTQIKYCWTCGQAVKWNGR